MTLGIGVIGSGGMGLTWADVVRRTRGAELRAIWGGSRANDLATQFGVQTEASLDALLARPDVNAVIIASPLPTHASYVLAAADAKRHVFLEKPMSLTLAEADAMVAAADGADVRFAVVTQHRFRVVPATAKRLIEGGEIGTVTMAHARGMLTWDPPAGHVPWAELGYHVCDVLRWLVGSDVVDIEARFRAAREAGLPSRTVMALLRFANGAIASIWLSYEAPPPGLGSQMQFLIVGTQGMLDVDSYAELRQGTARGWDVVTRQPEGDPADPLDDVRIGTYLPQFEDFVAAVRDHRVPVVDGHEARRTMRVVLGALAAAERASAAPADSLDGIRLR